MVNEMEAKVAALTREQKDRMYKVGKAGHVVVYIGLAIGVVYYVLIAAGVIPSSFTIINVSAEAGSRAFFQTLAAELICVVVALYLVATIVMKIACPQYSEKKWKIVCRDRAKK